MDDDFLDVDIVCADSGVVRASSFAIARMSSAEIVVEALRASPARRLHVPFAEQHVRAAVLASHSRLGFSAAHLKRDVEAVARVVDVFDFLGAQEFVDRSLEFVASAFRDAGARAMIEHANAMLKHSDAEFWDFVFACMAHAMPFWSMLLRALDAVKMDVHIARSIIRTLSSDFSPAWLFRAVCARLGTITAAQAADLLAAEGWGEVAHPAEVADVLDAVLCASRGAGCALTSALASLHEASVARGLLSRVSCASGSAIPCPDHNKLSVIVSRDSLGDGTRRRIAAGVHALADDGRVVFWVRPSAFAALRRAAPRVCVARIAWTINGLNVAERWMITRSSAGMFEFDSDSDDVVDAPDDLCIAVGVVPPAVPSAMFSSRLATGDRWIRLDAFMDRRGM